MPFSFRKNIHVACKWKITKRRVRCIQIFLPCSTLFDTHAHSACTLKHANVRIHFALKMLRTLFKPLEISLDVLQHFPLFLGEIQFLSYYSSLTNYEDNKYKGRVEIIRRINTFEKAASKPKARNKFALPEALLYFVIFST